MACFLDVAMLKKSIWDEDMWGGRSRLANRVLEQHFQLRLQPTVKSLWQLRPVSLLK
jgi:hypothetical protein